MLKDPQEITGLWFLIAGVLALVWSLVQIIRGE